MSAQTVTILSLEEVVDHDCGNYFIGEIDVRSGQLDKYFTQYGGAGFERLAAAMAKASWLVVEAYRNHNLNKDGAQCAASSVTK